MSSRDDILDVMKGLDGLGDKYEYALAVREWDERGGKWIWFVSASERGPGSALEMADKLRECVGTIGDGG